MSIDLNGNINSKNPDLEKKTREYDLLVKIKDTTETWNNLSNSDKTDILLRIAELRLDLGKNNI